MSADEVKTKATSLLTLNSFHATPIPIGPELLGHSLEFEQDGVLVRVRLPAKDRVDVYETGTHEADVSTCIRNKDGESIGFSVHVVDVITHPTDIPSLPTDPELRREFSSTPEGFRLVEAGSHLADRAFERFAGVIRWTTKRYWVARRQVIEHPRSWQGSLWDRDTQQRICGANHGRLGPMYVPEPITTSQWVETERALREGFACPIHFELLHAGQWLLDFEELRRAVVDVAAAAEVYMKNKVLAALPAGVTSAVRDHIARTNVSTHYTKLFPDVLPQGRDNTAWSGIKGDLNDLFEARNHLLHDGAHDHLKEADCRRYSDATDKLLNLI